MIEGKQKNLGNWRDIIVKNPQILAGKPTIKGTRLSVELITDLLEGGNSPAYIMDSYPGITLEEIEACRRYKATGAKLSNFTWEDLNSMMDRAEKESTSR